MDRKCQAMDVVYDCRVTSSEPQKIYFGLAEGKWKQRYYNHKKSFNHKRYSHERTFSSYVWPPKETLGAPHFTETSQKSSFCVCMKNYYYLYKTTRAFK